MTSWAEVTSARVCWRLAAGANVTLRTLNLEQKQRGFPVTGQVEKKQRSLTENNSNPGPFLTISHQRNSGVTVIIPPRLFLSLLPLALRWFALPKVPPPPPSPSHANARARARWTSQTALGRVKVNVALHLQFTITTWSRLNLEFRGAVKGNTFFYNLAPFPFFSTEKPSPWPVRTSLVCSGRQGYLRKSRDYTLFPNSSHNNTLSCFSLSAMKTPPVIIFSTSDVICVFDSPAQLFSYDWRRQNKQLFWFGL